MSINLGSFDFRGRKNKTFSAYAGNTGYIVSVKIVNFWWQLEISGARGLIGNPAQLFLGSKKNAL